MTTARSEIVDALEPGYYHCIARCVRRAFLCGLDSYSGKCYEHRKSWIRDRLKFLCETFAVECVSFAIMTNHLHTLLQIRPDIALSWKDEEVARRWCKLFPGKRENLEQKIKMILSDKDLIEKYRLRLSNLSWFNRCLNENIARRANAEDDCTGRFWQGRFKSQAIKTSAALLSCSVYVDLNPIRAGVAKTPEASDFTSVQVRIRSLANKHDKSALLAPKLVSHELSLGISEKTYIEIVDITGRNIVEGKKSIDESLAPILERLGIRSNNWMNLVQKQKSLFKNFIAPAETIRELASKNGKHWYQGIRAAERAFE